MYCCENGLGPRLQELIIFCADRYHVERGFGASNKMSSIPKDVIETKQIENNRICNEVPHRRTLLTASLSIGTMQIAKPRKMDTNTPLRNQSTCDL